MCSSRSIAETKTNRLEGAPNVDESIVGKTWVVFDKSLNVKSIFFSKRRKLSKQRKRDREIQLLLYF